MEILGALIVVYVLLFIVQVAIALWTIIALGGVFKKAGEPAWKAWVPVYNTWTFVKLGGLPGFWALVALGGIFVVYILSAIISATATSYEAIGAASIVMGLGLTVFGIGTTVLYILVAIGITRGFGLGGGYVALAILVSPVWLSILAWGSAQWIGLPGRTAQPAVAPPPPPPAQAENFVLSTATTAPPPPPPAATDAPAAAPAPAAYGAPASFAPPPPPPPAAAQPAPIPVTPAPAPTSEPAPAAFAPPPAPAAPVAASPWQPPINEIPGRGPLTEPAPAAPAAPAPAAFAPPAAAPVAEVPVAEAPVSEVPVSEVPAAAAAPAPAADIEGDDEDDRTVVVSRRRTTWSLTGPDGSSTVISKPVVIVGRKPVRDSAHPDAQLVSLADTTRTMSKNHALLREVDDAWVITDLNSTNGVVVTDGATEVVLTPGVEAALSSTFLLGEARVELTKES